jgi:hypothetical protein
MGAGMSRGLLAFVVAAVRGWTWVYTLPLDGAARHARRAEIASDVWEFQHDPASDEGSVQRAAHLLVRAMLGVPDDLLWCCEQLPEHPRALRPFAVIRVAVLIAAASGLVVSASRPPLDISLLRFNVAASGWVAVATPRAGDVLVPALAFTLANSSDRPTSALQVNALFYGSPANHEVWGGTFVSVVGGHGLASGATSRAILVSPQHGSSVWDDAGLARRLEILHVVIPESRVKLFLRHEGRWTLLADCPIHQQLMQP